jgi:hypothetical protein
MAIRMMRIDLGAIRFPDLSAQPLPSVQHFGASANPLVAGPVLTFNTGLPGATSQGLLQVSEIQA